MRKLSSIVVILFFLFFLLFINGCGDKTKITPKEKLDLLTYIPEDASGIFSFNFEKFSKLEIFDNIIEEEKSTEDALSLKFFKGYQDFIDKTGIDPKVDIYTITVAVFGDIGMVNKDVVFLINSNYNKDKLLNIIKEKNKNVSEESYKEGTIYKIMFKKDETMALSFMEKKIIAMGKTERVKQVIDLFNGEGNNILKNKKMKTFIKKFKAESIVSFVLDIPDEVKKVQGEEQGSPFKMDLTKAEAMYGFVDYNNNLMTGEIILVSFNEEGNKQVVNTLNMFKGMGAMGGPEIAEVLNNIHISASSEDIKLTFSISNDLFKKLHKKIENQIKGKILPTPPTQ